MKSEMKRAFLVLFLLASGAAAQAPSPAASPTPIVSRPVTSPGNADWAASPGEAKARAAAEQKLVFIQIDKEGRECGQCRRMEALLYPAFDFEALLASMVPVRVPLASPEGRELASRYSIQETPSVLVTTPEGRLVFLMQGFQSAPDFYQHIHTDLRAYREFAKKVEAQDIARLPAREALQTGMELYQRSDSAAALSRLRRAVSAPDGTRAGRESAREILAAVELDLGQIAASRQTIERLIATSRDSDRKERAELFRAQLPLAENKPEEAAALFRRFQKDHPNSNYRQKVQDMLDRLTKPPR